MPILNKWVNIKLFSGWVPPGFGFVFKAKRLRCEKEAYLSYGDVHVGSEEGKGDGSQQDVEVHIVLGVEHLNLGLGSGQGWIKGNTLNLSICHLEGTRLTAIPPIDRFA